MKYLITHYTIKQGTQTIFTHSIDITTSDLQEGRKVAKNAFIEELLKMIDVELTYKELPDEATR